mgnify:FL=1|tara:strand:- start:99 stop:419 length:321 start_codon:yes stop_codon:yes gene_type:complete
MNNFYNELSNRQKVYVDAIREHGPAMGLDITKTVYTRAELRPISEELKGKPWIPNWITHDQSRRDGRGAFSIPEVPLASPAADADLVSTPSDDAAPAVQELAATPA